MATTPEQLEKRKSHLGSSDIAAILGLDPFRSAYDVYLEKTGKLEEQPESTDIQKRGQFLEPALLNFAESILGQINREAPEQGEGLIIAHPDGVVIDKGNPVEAKSQGVYSKESWGDEGTDQVPDRVIIQCEVHLLTCKADYCHIPAYLPYREFVMFGVEKDKDIINEILQAAHIFWQNNVVRDTPPEDSRPSLQLIKRIRHTPEKVIDIPIEVANRWQDARQARLDTEKLEKMAEADLRAALADAEAGKFEGGMITLYETIRKAYEVKETKFRTLRFVKE